jgi:hypothetical protein
MEIEDHQPWSLDDALSHPPTYQYGDEYGLVFGNASDIVQDQVDLTVYLTYGGNAYGNGPNAPVVMEH